MITAMMVGAVAVSTHISNDDGRRRIDKIRTACTKLVAKKKTAFIEQLANARMLTDIEFSRDIVAHRFVYKSIDGQITLTYPREFFFADGRYLLNNARYSVSGKFSFDRGFVWVSVGDFIGEVRSVVTTPDKKRYMIACTKGGAIYEMTPE